MKTAVIDLDSIAYAIGNGNKVIGEDGLPLKKDGKLVYVDKTQEELANAAEFYMRTLMSAGGFTHYIAFIKGSGTTKRRLAAYPEYKGQRGKVAPHWWDYVRSYLKINWNAIEASGHEVDDYVNVTRLKMKDSYIVSIDGDLLGLEGTHYNWKTGNWITVNAERARAKFWTDMIAGQSVDNIKGIPGKGEAYANNMFSPWGRMCPHRTIVFSAYIRHFGELKGIEEFYKNYICLKILEDIPDFTPPQPFEYKAFDPLRS